MSTVVIDPTKEDGVQFSYDDNIAIGIPSGGVFTNQAQVRKKDNNYYYQFKPEASKPIMGLDINWCNAKINDDLTIKNTQELFNWLKEVSILAKQGGDLSNYYTKNDVDKKVDLLNNFGNSTPIYTEDSDKTLSQKIIDDYVNRYNISEILLKDKSPEELNYPVWVEGETEEHYQQRVDEWVADYKVTHKQDYEDSLNTFAKAKENEVVVVPSKNEIDRKTKAYQYSDSGNGTYLDLLFNAIHSLQMEVMKLKNTFNYGIQSEIGTTTAISKVISEAEADAEPIWAVDEESLDPIINENLILELTPEHRLVPNDNVEVMTDGLKITNSAQFDYNLNEMIEEVESENKIYLYVTSTKLNIKFILTNPNDINDYITVDINEIFNNTSITYLTSKYNIMLCVSKKIEKKGEYEGFNFIWISISDYISGENLYSGFLNPNTNKLEVGLSNTCKLINSYLFDKAIFSNLSLYKYDMYKKLDSLYTQGYQYVDTVPTTNDFIYKAAHITIRGCANYNEIMSIKDQLLERELILDDETRKLYTKLNNKIIQISGSPEKQDDTGMTETELIELLERNGIINITHDGTDDIELNSIADITFIHQATGKKFKFEVNEEGNLHSTELSDFDSESKENITKVLNTEVSNFTNIRGFIGSLGNYNKGVTFNAQSDLGLYADRLKIGAIYAPSADRTVYGCSHAFIELENTSDKDIPLNDFYIHYGYSLPDNPNTYKLASLKLNGFIPAGGTYLIRGKQYADENQANVNIVVDKYDIEWYVGDKLIDLTWHDNKDSDNNSCAQTYLLTYGVPENFTTSTLMYGTTQIGTDILRSFNSHFVDVVAINDCVKNNTAGTWFNVNWRKYVPPKKSNGSYYDVIFKNVFELDPAKQAFQGWACLATANGTAGSKIYDSSRARNDKDTDFQYLVIEDDKIVFPKSNISYDINRFTPKASFEHKNVCTDKTQLDLDRPNMVTVSFGINIHKTRCFNWISAGLFDEYIWIKKKTDTEWKKFESYHDSPCGFDSPQSIPTQTEYPYRKSFGTYLNKYTTSITGSDKYDSVESVIYDRITGVFPGCNIAYTSHKCVIELCANAVESPETWEYFVGRANSDGSPNEDHISETFEFTLYPTSYIPRVFQTTDQQGFHWIEYQPWAAAANEINKIINNEQQTEHIIPILINTGDMTQNGTRINEWLDYYEGGKNLFNHLEQMNVVGNNDLCNTNPEILGTGDDPGKSNGFYFHVFYCYEIDPDILPIISNERLEKGKYIPSFYYFGNDAYSFVMFNTEITVVNCKDWFKQIKNDQTVNVYTGWLIKDSNHTGGDPVYDDSFTTIYTMLYNVFDKLTNTKTIVACHEMPFTVVTNANLKTNIKNVDRSLSGKNSGSLVGCHCNLMNSYEFGGKGIYWFSRLMEHFNIKLVIGGHKHTYACTNPLRELYSYKVGNDIKFSNINGPMTMSNTLQNDTANFVLYYKKDTETLSTTNDGDGFEEICSSKFPLMTSTDLGITGTSDIVFPYFGVGNLSGGIVYAMCQATGYKLKSNKELPSANQKFSYIIPKTNNQADGTDKPNLNQQYAMFTEIVLSSNNYDVYLCRIKNITQTAEKGKESLFSQLEYSTQLCKYEYMKHEKANAESDIMYGHWVDDKTAMISISTGA